LSFSEVYPHQSQEFKPAGHHGHTSRGRPLLVGQFEKSAGNPQPGIQVYTVNVRRSFSLTEGGQYLSGEGFKFVQRKQGTVFATDQMAQQARKGEPVFWVD
jgi:hypothetical protein